MVSNEGNPLNEAKVVSRCIQLQNGGGGGGGKCRVSHAIILMVTFGETYKSFLFLPIECFTKLSQ